MYRQRISVTAFLFTFIFTTVLSFSALARTQAVEWNIPFAAEPVRPSVWGRLSFPYVPDASRTQGSLCTPQNPDFEDYRYDEQIAYCGRNVPSETKAQIYRYYGVSPHCKSEYTIDHFIPLSLGGTNEPNNLWPEHKSIKALRYKLENDLYKMLNAGKITQAEAVREIINAKLNPPVRDPSAFEFCL